MARQHAKREIMATPSELSSDVRDPNDRDACGTPCNSKENPACLLHLRRDASLRKECSSELDPRGLRAAGTRNLQMRGPTDCDGRVD